jgi:hypothetical protein
MRTNAELPISARELNKIMMAFHEEIRMSKWNKGKDSIVFNDSDLNTIISQNTGYYNPDVLAYGRDCILSKFRPKFKIEEKAYSEEGSEWLLTKK